ncbi:hypothetical protein NOCA2390069 [metagenome]|uniref:Uncharacterized protein n=1 Tax=metagenome TaxID=256318 RepID=A0A2P2C595_9ZZZZ
MSTSLSDAVTQTIERETTALPPPSLDLASIRQQGDRRRRTRVAGAGVVAAVTVVAGMTLVSALRPDADTAQVVVPPMDFVQGARAFYDQDRHVMHLGGRTFPLSGIDGLDTHATVTSSGVVFFSDRQQPRLLQVDGHVIDLAAAPSSPDHDFHPSATAEVDGSRVAWLVKGDTLTLGITDTVSGRTTTPDLGERCATGCADLSLAAVDAGFAFLEGDEGSFAVPLDGGTPIEVADGRVTDARNRVILVDGRVPATVPAGLGEGWRFARAQGVESLLTFDGGHELYWSTVLPSTEPEGRRLRLDLPGGTSPFVAMDTDGSVLAALRGTKEQTYYDCEVPSGDCTRIGVLPNGSGDPMFIGVDG